MRVVIIYSHSFCSKVFTEHTLKGFKKKCQFYKIHRSLSGNLVSSNWTFASLSPLAPAEGQEGKVQLGILQPGDHRQHLSRNSKADLTGCSHFLLTWGAESITREVGRNENTGGVGWQWALVALIKRVGWTWKQAKFVLSISHSLSWMTWSIKGWPGEAGLYLPHGAPKNRSRSFHRQAKLFDNQKWTLKRQWATWPSWGIFSLIYFLAILVPCSYLGSWSFYKWDSIIPI